MSFSPQTLHLKLLWIELSGTITTVQIQSVPFHFLQRFSYHISCIYYMLFSDKSFSHHTFTCYAQFQDQISDSYINVGRKMTFYFSLTCS